MLFEEQFLSSNASYCVLPAHLKKCTNLCNKQTALEIWLHFSLGGGWSKVPFHTTITLLSYTKEKIFYANYTVHVSSIWDGIRFSSDIKYVHTFITWFYSQICSSGLVSRRKNRSLKQQNLYFVIPTVGNSENNPIEKKVEHPINTTQTS